MLDIAVFMGVWPCILVESIHINWTKHKAMTESQLIYEKIILNTSVTLLDSPSTESNVVQYKMTVFCYVAPCSLVANVLTERTSNLV